MAWAPDYITVAQAKAFLRDTLDVDDVELGVYATAASRAIDDHCNRQFGQVDAPEARTFTAWPDYERGVWTVTIDDLMDDTGLTVTVDGATVTAYRLKPSTAAARGRPWTRLVVLRSSGVQPTGDDDEVAITGRWGWSTVPSPVALAARLQVSRFAARRESPHGVAGSPDAGGELRLLARLDPDVAVSLRGYQRPRRMA